MSNIEQHTIDKLFRDLIRVYSTSATSMLGLDSIQTAIKELVCEDSDLFREIRKLSDAVKNTQPRMFPLDNLMLILDKKLQSLLNENQLTKKSVAIGFANLDYFSAFSRFFTGEPVADLDQFR